VHDTEKIFENSKFSLEPVSQICDTINTRMRRTEIVIYQEEDGQVPLLEWLDGLHPKVQDKCISKVDLLGETGYDLRRPHCDLLEQGIYELRFRHLNVHYRVLYAFVGENIVLLSHGCSKKDRVPKTEINRAIRNCNNYLAAPKAHTYAGEL
jgi:phage-related protein